MSNKFESSCKSSHSSLIVVVIFPSMQRELEKKQKQEKVAEMNSRADSHYRFSLLRNYGLKPWRKLIVASHQHWQVAVDHHSYALLQTYLLPWHRYTQTTKSEQCSMADAKYKEILLQRSLNSWKQVSLSECSKCTIQEEHTKVSNTQMKEEINNMLLWSADFNVKTVNLNPKLILVDLIVTSSKV